MTPEKAEILALEGLGWLAGEPESMGKFLNLSGMDAAALRDAAGEPDTGLAVLDFLLGQDALLLKFCESLAVEPRQVHAARHALARDTSFE
jgi:hypothetical protein